MAYIGKTPVIGNFVKLDAISVVNGQAAYTMQNGGVNFTSYDNVNQFLVSLNGILQSPTDSFTVSGSTLTFASNLSTGDVIDFVMVLGNTLDVGTPSDNTVSLAKLTATGTKDATTFLRGDNTFAAAGSPSIDDNGDATAITIDSDEKVLINKTSAGSANVGAEFSSSGSSMTRSGGTPLIINRTTNFGELIKFRKDNSDVGKIDCTSAGIGIYLGGTAAANNLDDYEEGTFTPTWTGSSSVSVASGNYGYYTKIGNVVTVHFGAVLSSSSNSYYAITNAPFQSNIASGSAMGSAREYGHTGYSYVTIMGDNSTTISMVSYQNNAVANAYLACSLTYRTD